MSRLIYKGDTVKNFGEFLPSPFIEKIVLRSNNKTFGVTFSLYVLVSEVEEEQDAIAEHIQDNLTCYVYLQGYPSTGTELSELLGISADLPNIIDIILNKEDSILRWAAYAYGNTAISVDTAIEKMLEAYGAISFTTEMEPSSEGNDAEISTAFSGLSWTVFDELVWRSLDASINPEDYYSTKQYEDGEDPKAAFVEWLTAYLESNITELLENAGCIIEPQEITWHPGYTSTEYDDNGNLVLKMSSTTNLNFENPLYDDTAGSWEETYEKLALFAFSSTVDEAAMTETSSDDVSKLAVPDLLENYILSNIVASDVSYEILIENSLLTGQAEQIWIDELGNPFDDTPLQEIMQTYHKPVKMTHKDIVNGFEELLSKFETQAETDSDLKSIMGNVSYVLGVYGTEADLLPQLNKLRKAWPIKSSVTNSGQLYNSFKKTLSDASKTVGGDPVLTKQLVANPKIIDERNPSDGSFEGWRVIYEYDGEYYTAGELEDAGIDSTDEDVEQYSPIKTGDYPEKFIQGMGDPSFYPEASTETFFTYNQSDLTDSPYGVKTTGFLFLDIQALLYKSCNLSTIIDVKKLDDLFGHGLLNSRCYLLGTSEYPIEFTFYNANEQEASPQPTALGTLEIYTADEAADDDGNPTGTAPPPIVTSQILTPDGSQEAKAEWETAEGDTLYTYCIPRNFAYTGTSDDYPDSDDIGDDNTYRLLVLEYQLIYKYYTAATLAGILVDGYSDDLPYSIKAIVYMRDNTLDIADALATSFSNIVDSFEEYYDACSEPCNYNEDDGTFNRFFVEAMTAAYKDSVGKSPWLRAPLLLNLHRDLIYDTFDGDYDQILEESKTLANRLSPYGGTLDAVESFFETLGDFYDDEYSASNSACTSGGNITKYACKRAAMTTTKDFMKLKITQDFNGMIYDVKDYETLQTTHWTSIEMMSATYMYFYKNYLNDDDATTLLKEKLQAVQYQLGDTSYSGVYDDAIKVVLEAMWNPADSYAHTTGGLLVDDEGEDISDSFTPTYYAGLVGAGDETMQTAAETLFDAWLDQSSMDWTHADDFELGFLVIYFALANTYGDSDLASAWFTNASWGDAAPATNVEFVDLMLYLWANYIEDGYSLDGEWGTIVADTLGDAQNIFEASE